MNAEIKNMTEEQIAELEAQIKEWRKEKERKPLAWKPKEYEWYWRITSSGTTDNAEWFNDYYGIALHQRGGVFRTQKLAQAEVKRRQVKRQIEELIDKYDSERGGAFVVGKDNYCFPYCLYNDEISIGNTVYTKETQLPYFSSYEVAKQIRDEIGAENIKLLFTEYPIVRGE